MTSICDIVIIGGGPAGLAAAAAAYRSGVHDIILLERDIRLGGILQQCIHNGFGLHHFGEELTGPEYASRFIDDIQELGITYWTDTTVLDVEQIPTKNRHLVTAVNTQNGLIQLQTKAVILATGCRERTRGALTIPGTRPAGIFTAGSAQRFVNIDGYLPGRKIVILGSGDIGLIMARRLTLEGAEVKLICEVMPFSSGLARNKVQCVENFNIPLKFSHTVTQIHGTHRVEGVTVSAVDSSRKPLPGTEEYIECDTLLLSVGLIPENEIALKSGIQIDAATAGPIVNEYRETTVPGIFACGNAVHVHDLVDFVTTESMCAGNNAAKYVLNTTPVSNDQPVSVRAGNRVRYTVPQYLSQNTTENENGCDIMLRTTDVYRNISITAYSSHKRIATQKKNVVSPGEMLSIHLSRYQLQQIKETLTVSIELPEEDID